MNYECLYLNTYFLPTEFKTNNFGSAACTAQPLGETTVLFENITLHTYIILQNSNSNRCYK